MKWQPTPASLNAASGRFAGPIANVDTAHWDTSWWRRRLQRKAWVYAGVHHAQYSIGFAMIDAGVAASAFVYVFERAHQRLHEYRLLRPFGFAAGFAPSAQTYWHLQQGGQQFDWHYQPDSHLYVAQYHGSRLSVCLSMHNNQRSISALNHPIGRPFHYTEKNIGLNTHLRLQLDGRQYDIHTEHGLFDFSLGYMPRHTQWQWASLSGVNTYGEPIGINAVAQYFNGLENTAWYRHTPQPLGQICFEYSTDVLKPWHIYAADGSVDVAFTPAGIRQENRNLGLWMSRFQQPFGHFTGRYTDPSGHTHHICGHGVVEQHCARW